MAKTLIEVFKTDEENRTTPHIFGPDYYARLAGKPSGGGKKSASEVTWPPRESRSPSPSQDTTFESDSEPPQLPTSPPPRISPWPIEETESTPPPALPKVAPPPRNSLKIEGVDFQSEESIPELPKILPPPRTFLKKVHGDIPEPPKSRPPSLQILESHEIQETLKLITPETDNMPFKTEVTTSDSDVSFTNFYDVEHAQVVIKSKNEDVLIPIRSTPLGLSYKQTNDKIEEPVNNNNYITINNEPVDPPVPKPRVLAGQTKNYSFDTAPKITTQKKDNTLIGKIYKDPKVRLFAMNSREDITDSPCNITQDNQKITHARGEISVDDSSDDGLLSETGRMSFYSSEEDLLSISSEPYTDIVATKNSNVKLYTDRFDDGTPSPGPLATPRTPSTRKFIYGSHDDLLSIDELLTPMPKKKDNTLISKIYNDPNVRNFALKTSHKDMVPLSFEVSRTPSPQKLRVTSTSDDEQLQQNSLVRRKMYRSLDDLISDDVKFDVHGGQESTSDISISLHSNGKENGLDVEKGDNVKSNHSSDISSFDRSTSFNDDGENIRVSVRDLRKKFEKTEVNYKPVISSLTARSLSKQVKESLRQ